MTFEQQAESGPTHISWNISGNDPNAERGFHVHQFGDNTNGCTSAGPHCRLSSCTSVSKLISAVNPFSHAHAGPNDAKRHVGDLGNIKTNAQGNAIGNVEDKWIKLIGEQSVLGVCFPPAEKR